jgi:hypothetical protein
MFATQIGPSGLVKGWVIFVAEAVCLLIYIFSPYSLFCKQAWHMLHMCMYACTHIYVYPSHYYKFCTICLNVMLFLWMLCHWRSSCLCTFHCYTTNKSSNALWIYKLGMTLVLGIVRTLWLALGSHLSNVK